MTSSTFQLTQLEKQAISSIASIFALRMLGLFMIVPLFAIYAHALKDATPLLIGAAMGCYGLSQALLQLPFGRWSDRFGRKPVIAMGLILFILGSVIAALSHSIWAMIIGRTLQGAGAVGSASQALLADLTRTEQRTKSMAVIGITIGISFTLAMLIGPILSNWFSMAGLFWLSALLGIAALVILFYLTPSSEKNHFPLMNLQQLWSVLRQPELLRLNLGILFLHAILTANFFVLPQLLQNSAGLIAKHQWYIYLPVLILAFISMLPFLQRTRDSKYANALTFKMIGVLACSQLGLLLFHNSFLTIGFSLWIFFTAFTLLEATLPSAVSKLAPAECRGAALGFFSSCQFLGIFLGGIIGGWLYGYFQFKGVFCGCLLLALIWLSTYLRSNKQPTIIKTESV